MDAMYDLIIIGAGPAGLAAGIYGGRAHLNTLILEKSTVGGRAYTTREIVNYPGIPSTSGPDLTEKMAEHAESFGVEIKREPVKSMDVSGDVKLVKTRRHEYGAKAVVIATGTSARILGIPGERELTGQGVAYCATCDAEFFQDQHVVVVGSGDQAIEEGMFITKFASRVTVIVLHEEGVLDCNKQAAEKALSRLSCRHISGIVIRVGRIIVSSFLGKTFRVLEGCYCNFSQGNCFCYHFSGIIWIRNFYRSCNNAQLINLDLGGDGGFAGK